MIDPRNRRSRSRRPGAAVVELAVCLPILFVFVVGTIEASHTIYRKQSLAIAAYEGARVALIAGSNAENVRAQCEKMLAARRIKDAIVQVAPENFETLPVGTFVAVEISAPRKSNGLLPETYFGEDYLQARVEMMREF